MCGDIESSFDAVFNKVRNLSAKTNFAFLLCVGNFFGESAGSLDDYKTGKKKGKMSISDVVFSLQLVISFSSNSHLHLGPKQREATETFRNV